MIVDVGLPDTDGRDLCQALRARGFNAPLLFLTARDAPADRISGFTAGGDDYVTKPFDVRRARGPARALARRSRASTTDVVGDLRLDPLAHASPGQGREHLADADRVPRSWARWPAAPARRSAGAS